MGIFSSLRQFLYPREFRITPVKPYDLTTILKVIANVVEKEVTENTSKEPKQFLTDLSISLWRLHQKLLQPETDQPFKDMHHAYRSLTSIWNSLIQVGIALREHTNQSYDSGLSLQVISYEESSGITAPKVIETIKPTIYLHGNPIQFGEVIVGIPHPE